MPVSVLDDGAAGTSSSMPAWPGSLGSVALVHDYLNQPGGAERVVLAMAGIWPTAPIYTSLYRADSTFPGFGAADIRLSPLHWLPVDRGFRNLFPLYPAAFRSFGALEYDVVISSSSGWAHQVRTATSTFHAVYCHAPARWLYGGEHLLDLRRQVLRPAAAVFRTRDRLAARRADLYIANSHEVRRRIARHYGVEAPVVYPPVDVARFRPRPRGERLLVVSRLLPYKRIDAIVAAATQAGLGLDVVGTGPALADLRRAAGPTVRFHGQLSDRQVTELMEQCRALCVPGREDFGITTVEALAAGKPVVAFAAGGSLETIEEGVTGAFFRRHEPDDVLDAIRRCDEIDTDPQTIAAAARRFAPSAFEQALIETLSDAVRTHANGHAPPVPVRQAPSPPPGTHEDNHNAPPVRLVPQTASPRPLMLGKGWFPDQLGGLDRYYRSLLEHLPEASGVVIGADAATPTHVKAVSGNDLPLVRRILAFWRAAQEAAEDADIVDVHFALYALAPLWVGRLRRKPVVLHFHGPWADESVAAGDASGLRRFARRALERAAYRRAAGAVVLTSAFRQVLVERYRLRPWNIYVQPPGVDLEYFTPGPAVPTRQAMGLGARAFVAVTVRRMVPRMGLELLIDSWEEAIPDLPVGSTLLIVGDGPLRQSLEARAVARGLTESVRFLGRVNDEHLVNLYRAADVAVVPSLAHEGFGMVVLEAAACGTPTIVSEVGGLPEAAAGLDPSLIVPTADRAALRDRLLRAQTQRPSRAATRAYAERSDWDAVAEGHRKIMRRAAGTGANDNRLRVVYLDHGAQLSGGEIALTRLLPHLERVTPHVVLAENGPLVGRLHLEGVSTEVLPLHDSARDLRMAQVTGGGVSPEVMALSAAYVLRLAARLRSLRPDLVHTNSLKAGIYGSLAARLAGVPVVWHVRDRITEDYLPSQAVTLVRWMSRHFASAVVASSHSTLATLNVPSKSSVVVYSVLPEVMTHVPLRQRAGGNPLTRETLKTAAQVDLERYSTSIVAEELQQLYETVTARSRGR